MRILHALHFFLPKHSGGTEVYTQRLARAQSRRHDVALFYSEKLQAHRNYELLTRRVEGLDCRIVVNNLLYPGFEATFDNPVIEERFDQVLSEFRPDVVHVQHLMLLSLGLVARAKRRGARVVLTLQDFWLWCARMGQLIDSSGERCDGPEPGRCSRCLADFPFTQKKGAEHAFRGLELMRRMFGVDLSPLVDQVRGFRPLLPRKAVAQPVGRPISVALLERRAAQAARLLAEVDHVIAPSRMLFDHAAKAGVAESRRSHLEYGVDQAAAPVGRDYAPGGFVRFAFLGTPVPHKGVHVLIDAFRAAGLEHAELTIWGSAAADAAYSADLKRRAQGLRVRFAGAVRNDAVPAVLSRVDALVVPSLWFENWPLVVQEARLARVPVIASRIGGLAEGVRHGVDGLHFAPGDAVALALAMRHVAAWPARLREFAAAAPMPPSMAEHEAALDALYAGGTPVARAGDAP
jgi:glycosyltransferase involved in cell wall biosynthesis